MKYLRQLQDLESTACQKMGSIAQITIDWIQNTESNLNRDWSKQPIWRDELGAISYRIETLLELINPERTADIELLKRLNNIIKQWKKDIEFGNITLGIPREQG